MPETGFACDVDTHGVGSLTIDLLTELFPVLRMQIWSYLHLHSCKRLVNASGLCEIHSAWTPESPLDQYYGMVPQQLLSNCLFHFYLFKIAFPIIILHN